LVFNVAIVLTAIALALLGLKRVRFTESGVFKSSLEALVIGGIAATDAFLIGFLLEPLATQPD
jgi:VIT1/CCC1 family predicted Fe2+/Mn2+ transporter